MSIEAMKQALEALEEAHYKMEHYQNEDARADAIDALRTAIAKATKTTTWSN
jgi:hypothetical protein